MSPAEKRELLSLVKQAAVEASAHAMTGFRKMPSVTHKGQIDLLTDFDLECEARIRSRLAPLGIPIVGEEEGGASAGDGLTLYVDPIDGTTNFAHGHFFFCTSIGLLDGSAPVLGVVSAPALSVVWEGIVGQGAFRNGEPSRVSSARELDQALLATGFPYDRRTSSENNFAAYLHMKRRCLGVRRCGSAAIDLCLVADGTYDGYWEIKLRPWDLAAGLAMVMASGGAASDTTGREPDVRTGELLATNGYLHRELLEELAVVRTSGANP